MNAGARYEAEKRGSSIIRWKRKSPSLLLLEEKLSPPEEIEKNQEDHCKTSHASHNSAHDFGSGWVDTRS
jgi:hypothetical protein